jgi:uncharacterized protein
MAGGKMQALDRGAPGQTEATIRAMAPVLLEGRFVFRTIAGDTVPDDARAMFREREGVSVIVPASEDDLLVMRQITLTVHSALDGVGLTAAVASALAAEGIACNMVAARHHDHVFVPEAQAQRALAVLERLAMRGGRQGEQ